MKQKYSHALALAFEASSEHETGEDLTAGELRAAIIRRLSSLDDEELSEAIGVPWDTHEIEPDHYALRCPQCHKHHSINIEAVVDLQVIQTPGSEEFDTDYPMSPFVANYTPASKTTCGNCDFTDDLYRFYT